MKFVFPPPNIHFILWSKLDKLFLTMVGNVKYIEYKDVWCKLWIEGTIFVILMQLLGQFM